jgi:hypothetical protein
VALSKLGDAEGGLLQFLEVESMSVIEQIELPSPLTSLAWSPEGEQVAGICQSGELVIARLGDHNYSTWSKPTAPLSTRLSPKVAYTPDGQALVVLKPTGVIEVRDAATGALRFPALESQSGKLWSFAVSRDSRLLATTTSNGEVRIWQMETGAQSGQTLVHPGWVYRCRFSPDSTQLLTTCHDSKCRIWDLRSEAPVAVGMTHPNEVYGGAFLPAADAVITACRDGNIRVWEIKTGQLLAPPFKAGAQAFNVELSADGKYAVVGALGEEIHILSLRTLVEDVPWTTADLRLLTEVVSGSVISQGEMRHLTSTEWLQRLKQLQRTGAPLLRFAYESRLAAPSRLGSVGREPPAAAQADLPTTGCPYKATCTSVACPEKAEEASNGPESAPSRDLSGAGETLN